MNRVWEINTDYMRRIVARLPNHNRSRWRDLDSSMLKKIDSPPDIRNLTEFLSDRARAENDPIYGRLTDPLRERRSKHEEQKKRYETVSSSLPNLDPVAIRLVRRKTVLLVNRIIW